MLSKKLLKTFLCTVCVIILLSDAQNISLYVRNGMILCYMNVIPALYPFMVITNYIAGNNLQHLFSSVFRWYSRLMKIEDNDYPSYIFLSALGGFVTGSILLKKLHDKGYDKNALIAISPSMTNNSASFFLFVVGAGCLGSVIHGALILAAVFIASLITSFIFSFVFRYNIVSTGTKSCCNTDKQLVECINDSVGSIISVCGFVIIFFTVCEVVSLYINHVEINLLLTCITEITSGCAKLLDISGKNGYLYCILLSGISLSSLCQINYFSEIKELILPLILSRLIMIPTALALYCIFANLFPVAVSVINPESISVKMWYNSAEITASLYLLSLSFILVFKGNKLFTKSQE